MKQSLELLKEKDDLREKWTTTKLELDQIEKRMATTNDAGATQKVGLNGMKVQDHTIGNIIQIYL